ncbi:MAG: dipeptidase [Bacteroidetes bacterium]|nr:MAG: dipeptidase [Bacteroidota bacterium]
MRQYLVQHKDRFLQELFEFLRIPSISADSRYKADVTRAAEWLIQRFEELGIDRATLYPTPGHPIVYAERILSPDKPTVLIYGHYDVQPPDPLDLWKSPPFEPEVRDGKIYARGACDDKGQLYMHLKAMEVLHQLGEWPCNVKFVIEGEEEVGSNNLEDFTRAHKDMLSADVILVSDTSMIANDTPSITVGLRGLAYMEVAVTGPNRDLHSGVYGGAVENPINALCEMIASLKDENNRITIPGFYEDVVELSEAERAAMARQPFNESEYRKELGIPCTRGEMGYSTLERASIRPTLDVNGIWGGYTGEGAKTVLPAKAFAKISMRLVPNQRSEKIAALFTEHFKKLASPCVKVEVTTHHGGEPAVVSTDSPGYRAAAKAMQDTFGKEPIPTREGGSIPIVAMFKEVLGLETVLMGFGLNSDAIHSPNEHFGIFNYLKGIETIARFHQRMAGEARQ